MAGFIFELGSQTDASGFAAGDTLYFKDAAPVDVGVSYTPASGLSTATVTLNVGTQSLTFAADALGGAAAITFIAADGELVIGTSGADAALATTSDSDSAIWGLAGADGISLDGDGNHIAHGGDGGDTIDVEAGSTGALNIFGEAGDDTVTNAGGTGALNIYGGLGADTIDGSDNNDHIYGNVVAPSGTVADGADSITAGDGSDYVNGNAGADTIDGEGGSDRLRGGADADSIDGSAGNDDINGNKGDDTISGGDDDDSLRGGADDDSITGDAGNDIISGDLGDDNITGGAGADVMTGGAGADVFVFDVTDAAVLTVGSAKFYDTVADYVVGEDTLDFSTNATLPTDVLYVTGATYSTVAAATTAAQTALTAGDDGDLVAIAVGTDTYLFFDADVNDGTIDSVIKLSGIADASTITIDDFV